MEKIKIFFLLITGLILFTFANTPDFLSTPISEQPERINPAEKSESFYYPSMKVKEAKQFPEPLPIPFTIFWDSLAPVPAMRFSTAGCCDTSGHFYVIGGWINDTLSNEVYKYFAFGDSWHEMQPMPYAMTNMCAIFHSPTNKIFVFCGYDSSLVTNYTQIYDVVRDSWYLGTQCYVSMVGTYGAAVGDTIYVTGSDLSAFSLGIFAYSVSGDTWSFRGNLPGGGATGRAAAYNNKVYFAGGWPGKDTVCEYTVGVGISNSLFTRLPQSAYGFGMEVVRGILWCFGLQDGWGDTTNGVYSYDLAYGPNGNWQRETPMLGGGAYVSGKMFFENAWRLHAASMFHERGTILIPSIDAKLLRINQPPSHPPPNSVVAVNVTIKNNGRNLISNIPVTIWIDSEGSRLYNQSQTITGPLNPNDTVNITFTNFNTGGPGTSYFITAFTDLPGDSDRTNDTLSRLSYIPGLIWTELPSAPGTTYACADCGDTSGHFYVLGGFVNDIRSDNNWLYDEITRTWTIKQNLPNPAANFYAAYDLARNRIFCLGGTSPDSLLQIYHVDSDTWTMGSLPPTTSVGPFAIIGDTLYSFGSKLHRYHIPTNSWDFGISTPGYQAYCAICTYGREFYFSGGWSADPTVYKYTLETNTRNQLPDLPVGRHSHGMEVIDDKIVVFGGGQSWSPALNSVYVLDPHYPQAGWVSENSMVFGRIRGASAAVTHVGITRLHAACGYSGSANVNEHEAASYQITYIEEANSSYITLPLLKVIPTLSKHSVQIKVVTLDSGNGSIKVFDNCGRLIRKLSPILGKGEFTITWNKTDDNGISVSSGIYFIIFEKRGETLSEKVVIID
ncbi:MAG: hypothetical protein OEZ20_07015 [candidate division WOR-3 bacterium]|nr:hypothetical protein [candidate division WOR-3 bacterium]